MASGRKLVSVVIATSNRSASPRAAIDSVLAQTYGPLELLVVEGASVAEGRRRALRTARGVYVTFVDHADLLRRDKIARQVALLDASPRLGAVHCRHHVADATGRVIETVGRQPEGDVRVQLLRSCFPWSGGPLVRREILLRIRYDERVHWHDDWGLWLSVALAGHDFGCVQEPLGCHRVLPEILSGEQVAARERLVFDLLAEVYRRWALPAEVMAQKAQIHAGWHFRLGCAHASAGSLRAAARSFAQVAALCPEWIDTPGPLLDLLHAEATSPRARLGDPLGLIESVFGHPPFARARAAGASLVGRVRVALALHAHAAANRVTARTHFDSAIDADPGLLAAPHRLAAEVVAHARRIAADDPRALVLRVLDALPPRVRRRGEVRSLALAELAVAEAIRVHRIPRTPHRTASVAPSAGTHPPELQLRAPRCAQGRVVDRLRQQNPVRCAAEARDRARVATA